MTGQAFRSDEVCKLAGVTFRQLDYWDRIGLVTPSVTPANGSGTARRYSTDDLATVTIIRAMLDHGFTLQAIRRAIATQAGPQTATTLIDVWLCLLGAPHSEATV